MSRDPARPAEPGLGLDLDSDLAPDPALGLGLELGLELELAAGLNLVSGLVSGLSRGTAATPGTGSECPRPPDRGPLARGRREPGCPDRSRLAGRAARGRCARRAGRR
ncbi:hypothetical protein, partial [Frankia sp. AgKG'84/4]|uniref:hypothetical protein n=1 Tax=Frankia sp. AgKG'84/4 TaxID=573490 RepID=UPI002543D034